jgi:hypothetical protein
LWSRAVRALARRALQRRFAELTVEFRRRNRSKTERNGVNAPGLLRLRTVAETPDENDRQAE